MTVTTTTKLKKKLVSQAIEVLRDSKKHNEESQKKALFEEESSTLFLQILLKKIPKKNSTQMIKVNLPHSLLKDTDEVCLITGDTNKNYRKAETEPDVLHYKALLDKHGITQVSKIVTLRQLRTDYKPYADKQKLLAAYDVFIADNKIYECLPKVLGKFFYKKRKFPHKINMKSSSLKQQIEKALSIKMFYVSGNGNSCCSEVATLDMSNSDIQENVVEMINTVSKEVPGAWDNIMGIYLKTARSQSVPIYVSYEGLSEEKKKSAFKRKRDLSESGFEEKEPFICFESPKQDTKKRKVDPENLKKQQPFKKARKKFLQQKTKKNFKA